jgi:predicted NBD/HSP70 family sugar kinase
MEFFFPLNKDDTKQINKMNILNLIMKFEKISKSDLARYTSLSPATVGVLAEELIEEQLVVAHSISESTGGRKATLLSLDEHQVVIIGIAIAKGGISSCAISLSGEVLYEDDISIMPDLMISRIKDNIENIVDQILSRYVSRKCLGIGISFDGELLMNNVIQTTSNAFIRIEQYKQQFYEKYGVSIHVETRVNSVAIGEKLYGRAKNAASFFVLDIADAISAAYYVDGKIIRGYNKGTGNVGHIKVTNKSIKCRCGKAGCFDAVASKKGIEERYLSKLGELTNDPELVKSLNGDLTRINATNIYEYAVLGDKLSLNIIRETGHYIGTILSYIVNGLNPEMILITGMYNANNIMNREINKVLNKMSVHRNLLKVYVGEGALYRHTPALGAASLVVQDLMCVQINTQ